MFIYDNDSLLLPRYIVDVIHIIRNKNWLIHRFETEDPENLFNPANYLTNAIHNGDAYFVNIDTNILIYIVQAFSQNGTQDTHRTAIALLIFCRISHIQLDSYFALEEQFSHHDLERLRGDYYIIYNAFSVGPEYIEPLSKFALGQTDDLPTLPSVEPPALDELNKLVQKHEIPEWKTHYLIVLKITHLKFYEKGDFYSKIDKLLNWMFDELRISWVAIFYSVILLGKQPIRGIMKYKCSNTIGSNRKALRNMTWDIHLLSRFMLTMNTVSESEHYMFASADNSFQKILKAAIDCSRSGLCWSVLGGFLDDQMINRLDQFFYSDRSQGHRVYNTESWTPEYADRLIQQYETELLS